MRGIPNTIATKQDALNLIKDLAPDLAGKVLQENSHFFAEDEIMDKGQEISARARAEMLKQNSEYRKKDCLDRLAVDISGIRDNIYKQNIIVRKLYKEKNKPDKIFTELAMALEYTEWRKVVCPLEENRREGSWQALERASNLMSESDQLEIRKHIAAEKSKHKMKHSTARRAWRMYHDMRQLSGYLEIEATTQTDKIRVLSVKLKEKLTDQKRIGG